MTDTNIPVNEKARKALRQYKAKDGLTYSEAILQLIDENDVLKYELGE